MKTAPALPTTEGNELPVNETQGLPATDGGQLVTASASADAAALTAAVDGIVYAALHTAGQRITRTPLCPRPHRRAALALTATASVHTEHPVTERGDIMAYRLLDGAWSRVPEIAARYGVDDQSLAHAVDEYTAALLITGQPHTYENTVRMLAQSGIVPATLIAMANTSGTGQGQP
jgi:hypothetical protein